MYILLAKVRRRKVATALASKILRSTNYEMFHFSKNINLDLNRLVYCMKIIENFNFCDTRFLLHTFSVKLFKLLHTHIFYA
jgi:hypothetical protein